MGEQAESLKGEKDVATAAAAESTSEAAAEEDSKTAPAESDSALLPKIAPHDADHTWGDSASDRGHDAWLRENKPPHWG